MTTDVAAPQSASEIARVLDGLRVRIRRYVFAESLARFLAAAAVVIWVSIGIDWFFEPPRAVRGLLLVAAGTALVLVFWRTVVSSWLVPISSRSLALLLERRFPELHDELITAVEPSLGGNPADEPFRAQMLSATQRDAAERIRALDLDHVFRPQPLVQSVLVGAALVISVLVLALANPVVVGTWARRAVALSSELYPRKTRLSVEGFERGYVKVARGADFEIVAQADTSMVVPRSVQIQYETAGVRDRAAMDRTGNAVPPRDTHQKYSYTFHVLAPVMFDLVGGDDRIRDLRIEVVEVPTVDVSASYLECRYPDYLQRQPRQVPITAVVSLPTGTEVAVRAKANKPLVDVDVSDSGDWRTTVPAHEDDRWRFQLPLGALDESRVYQFQLHDTDGISSREPWRLVLAAIPDEPPRLNLRLRGIGTAITPQAGIPTTGSIEDDYGVTRIWFEHAVDDAEPHERPLTLAAHDRAELAVDEVFDVRELKLEPGQTFHLQVKASDNCGLQTGANVAASDRFALQVVTAEELRSMLESRELNLRRRFEQLVGEVTETRDTLSQLPSADREPAPGASAGEGAGSDEPVHVAALLVERALQNSRKNADETLGVAVAFDDIHDELVNNRVDTEELKSRLKQGIAEPLHRISSMAFPELERRLVGLQAALAAKAPATQTTHAAVLAQLDTILVDMQQVLDKMMEMETFNEVVDMLRAIIATQENINDETKKQRRQAVRDLLED
jgi:hypothetical protein